MNDAMDQHKYEQIKEGPFRPRDLLNSDVLFNLLVAVVMLAIAGYMGGYAYDEVLTGDLQGAALSVALGVLFVYLGLVLLDQLDCRLRESSTCRVCRKRDQRYMADGGKRIQYRDYVRAYVDERDIPPVPSDLDTRMPLREQLIAMAIVAVVSAVIGGLVAVIVIAATWPLIGAVYATYIGMATALVTTILSGTYLGGPAADYVLEVPREGVME